MMHVFFVESQSEQLNKSVLFNVLYPAMINQVVLGKPTHWEQLEALN